MAKKQQIGHSVPLVAIDLGSHGIRAMAAEMTDKGILRVLGVENSSKFDCVKKGIVDNTTDAGYMINEVLKKLSNRIHVDALPSAFVCVGGRTMQLVQTESRRDQVRTREIPQQLLDALEIECKQKIERNYPDVAVLDLIPHYYVLDKKEQDHVPTPDQKAALVEGHFIAFVGKKDLEQKVNDSFDRSGKILEHMYVRPDALMTALASDDDMANGCAILDLGAQTTTLTVYKGNQYMYNKVVAMGGYDITRDIEQTGMPLAYAEQLKCKYGFAMAELVKTNNRFRVPAPNTPQGEVTILATELADIITDRLDQIIPPLIDEINQEADRFKVLYITGGGAMLQGIAQYIQSLSKIRVMYGSHAACLTADTPDEICMPVFSSLVGTLLLGASYREKHPIEKKANKSFFTRIKDKLEEETLTLFTEQDEQSVKSKEDKQENNTATN